MSTSNNTDAPQLTNKQTHDLIISSMSPSYCRQCNASGADLLRNPCSRPLPKSSIVTIREKIEAIFWRPVHIDHQNVLPDEVTITKEGKEYYLDQFEALIQQEIREARIDEAKLFASKIDHARDFAFLRGFKNERLEELQKEGKS